MYDYAAFLHSMKKFKENVRSELTGLLIKNIYVKNFAKIKSFDICIFQIFFVNL